MATEKIATGIGFIPTFILASAIGYLLYRFIKPADWCEKNLQNHLRRYFAYAVLGATYASISPFYRYPFDQAVSTALAGVALVFCLAGLVALITWFFGSKSRSVTKAAVPEAQHNHSPTQSQTRESYYEEKGTTMSEKESEPISSPDTNAIYAEIAEEIEYNNTDKGLWTRLFAECDGDEKRTKVQYIKQRAAQLLANNVSLHSEQTINTETAINPEPISSSPTKPPPTKEPSPPSKYGKLTVEQVEYLESPILAVKYLEKYGVSKDTLANACAHKMLKSAWGGEILWVQDSPFIQSR